MPNNEYNLPARKPTAGEPSFPQVEPRASYWFRCDILCNVSFQDILTEVDNAVLPDGAKVVPPYETDEALLAEDIVRLKDFYNRRNDDFPQERLSLFLQDQRFTGRPPNNPSAGCPPVNAFIGRPPAGSVVSDPVIGRPLIQNGMELATLFEAETPTLWHNHVLNVFLAPENQGGFGLGAKLSPPLQALIWAALDLAISSALMTAWHYKWLATKANPNAKPGDDNEPDLSIARRQRPWEFDDSLQVLFDREVQRDTNGLIVRNALKPKPQPTPGTPRHPAYPSGHSTYSGAGSAILSCFFPDYAGEFRKLAENIGEARLWGGVHWRDDDRTGRNIGYKIGELIARQLTESGIYGLLPPDFSAQPATSPTVSSNALEQAADDFAESCGSDEHPVDFCQGLPPAGSEEVFQNLQG